MQTTLKPWSRLSLTVNDDYDNNDNNQQDEEEDNDESEMEDEIAALLQPTPRSTTSSSTMDAISRSFKRVPWVVVTVVGIFLPLLVTCLLYQIVQGRRLYAHNIMSQPFDLTRENWGEVSCSAVGEISQQQLWMKTQILFLLMSIPLSIISLLAVVSITLHHFSWGVAIRVLRFLDKPRPPLEFVLEVPGRVQDRPRKLGGCISIFFMYSVFTYIPYHIFSAYYLNTDIRTQSIQFPLNDTATDFVVLFSTKSEPFCDCDDLSSDYYCWKNLDSSFAYGGTGDLFLWVDSVECSNHTAYTSDGESYVVTKLKWSEHALHRNYLTEADVNSNHDIMPYLLDSTYLPIVFTGTAAEGGEVRVEWGLNSKMKNHRGTFDDVFALTDPTEMAMFVTQNICGLMTNFAPRMMMVEIESELAASCDQSVFDSITGAYRWNVAYKTVAFSNQQLGDSAPYEDDFPEDGVRFVIVRPDPVRTAKIPCSIHDRSFGKVLVQVMSFIGSMLGLRAFARSVIISMGERVYRRFRAKSRMM